MSTRFAAGSAERIKDAPRNRLPGFTLVELLVVMGIIGVLTALLAPAVQGLMGTTGRRGGLNTVTAVLEQARLAAIENGVDAHVGFPTNSANKTNGYSHLIVFRDARLGDTNTNPVTITKWQKLPAGVFFEPGKDFDKAVSNNMPVPPRALPLFGGVENLQQITVLTFNRFGQLRPRGATGEVVLRLGEKIDPMAPMNWRGSASNFYELRIQPLTGRVIVDDKLLDNQ